ncbi:MAG: cupin domain-containing protein [Bacteroidia bacterium]|jgi:mannose-6-phosphate isomerase-like protein (cupin superfamily)|nr:cupin domain-containing protein [Bacteroidia bacterium]
MKKINLTEKLTQFTDHWNPRVIASLNGQQVRLVKFKGEFVWHSHTHEDELFYVLKGSFTMQFRDRNVQLHEGEMIVVPRGVEHCPMAEEEVSVMLFEPAETVNTGHTASNKTRSTLEEI